MGSRWKSAADLSLRFLLIAAAVAVIIYVVGRLLLVVVPVAVALLVTTVLRPFAGWLMRRRWPPALATAVVVVVALALLAGVVALIGPPVARQMADVADQGEAGVEEIQDWFVEGPLGLSRETVEGFGDELVDVIRENAASIRDGVVAGAMVVTEVVFGALLALVLVVFFVKDGPGMWRWCVALVPDGARPRAEQLGEITWSTLSAYVRGIALVALFDSVLIGVALAIIGVPLVLPLAVLVFFGAFVPIVGAFATGGLAALVALVTVGPVAALLVIAAIVVIQQIEGDVLYPVVVGQALRLHPVAVLLAVAVGGVVAGIVGALFAVPIAAVAGGALEAVRAGPPPGGLEAQAEADERLVVAGRDPVKNL